MTTARVNSVSPLCLAAAKRSRSFNFENLPVQVRGTALMTLW